MVELDEWDVSSSRAVVSPEAKLGVVVKLDEGDGGLTSGAPSPSKWSKSAKDTR